LSFFSHINIVDKIISQTSIVEKIIVTLAQKQWLHMYCMRNHLVKYFEDNFPFFSSFITFFFLPFLLLPHGVALNLSKMISFSTIKKTISLFSPWQTSLFSLFQLWILSFAIHQWQPPISPHCHCHHYPQAPHLSNLRYIHLPLY
jgi:hypothetical protein